VGRRAYDNSHSHGLSWHVFNLNFVLKFTLPAHTTPNLRKTHSRLRFARTPTTGAHQSTPAPRTGVAPSGGLRGLVERSRCELLVSGAAICCWGMMAEVELTHLTGDASPVLSSSSPVSSSFRQPPVPRIVVLYIILSALGGLLFGVGA
jgi:hypothetical protein